MTISRSTRPDPPAAPGGRRSGAPTARAEVRRHPERGVYDREAIHAILDEALVCHLGFAARGQPFVIPTIHARDGETLYLHGSPASRTLRSLSGGTPACVTATILDGLVLARSAFHHSVNYRSVVAHGRAVLVTDPAERDTALAALVDAGVPGRSAQTRGPSRKEHAATAVLRLDLREVSLKARTHSAVDDPEDVDGPYWAGVVPLRLVAGAPEPAPDLREGVAVPEPVLAWQP